jgi:hypothetical protein
MGIGATYAPAARFPKIGDSVSGIITDGRMVQTSQYKTNRPEYWENKSVTFAAFAADGTPNEPKAQIELTVDTGVPDESGDPERRLFLKNKRHFAALRAALKAARARHGLVVGGWVSMTLTGTEPGEGTEEAKTWAIEYRPPAEGGFELDEKTIHLVGGGVYVKGLALAAPSAPVAATPSALASVAQNELDALADRQAEAIDRIRTTQQSSPLATRLGIARPVDDEPPF